jgi:hypothetical protein
LTAGCAMTCYRLSAKEQWHYPENPTEIRII